MAYLDLVYTLSGRLPGLSPQLARTFINDAWRGILQQRPWNFLYTDGQVVCPPQVIAGTASITQAAAAVTLSAAASAALLPQTLTGAVPGVLQLQFRVGSANSLGGIYSIIAVDTTDPTAIVLLMDRPLTEATNAASRYMIYRCYVIPPIPDFKRWESFQDFNNAIAITGARLTLTSTQIDMRDPQRQSLSLAYYLASFISNRIGNPITGTTVPNNTVNASTPIYELWPHPSSGQIFYVKFRRRGDGFTQLTDELPDQIPDALVMHRALYEFGYPFVAANKGNFPSFAKVSASDLSILLSSEMASYKRLYDDCVREDDAQQTRRVWNRGHGLRQMVPWGKFGPQPLVIDSNWLQSHLVSF